MILSLHLRSHVRSCTIISSPKPSTLAPPKSMKSTPLFEPEEYNSLGGALHEVPDSQIRKIVHIKFNDKPEALIKQLSLDIALKEKELILLRQETFAREQLLVKLCNEYGNLSQIEIDQKLASLTVDRNVDTVIGELIKDAMQEHNKTDRTTDWKPIPVRNTRDDSYFSPSSSSPSSTPNQRQRNGSSASLTSSSAPGRAPGSFPVLTSMSAHKSDPILTKENSSSSISSSYVKREEKPGLNRTDSLGGYIKKEDISSLNRPDSSYFEGFLQGTGGVTKISTTRVPMELVSMPAPTVELPPRAAVDKFGFFNDISKPEKDASKKTTEPRSHQMDSLISSLHHSLQLADHQDQQENLNPIETIDALDKLKELSLQHDAKRRQHEEKWHDFFIHLERDYLKYNGESELELDQGSMFDFKGLKLLNLDQKIKGPSYEGSYYKSFIKLTSQYGFPESRRAQLWFELSGAKNSKVPGEYQRLLGIAKVQETDDKLLRSNLNQIELDLHRTMPLNVYFNDLLNSKPGPHFYRLKNILYAYVIYRPDIGYCQGMNKIVSNLLLALELSEEDIFWVFSSLLEVLPSYDNRTKDFFDSRLLITIRNELKMFGDKIVPKYIPKLAKYLLSIHVQLDYIILNWWLLIFTEGCLPLGIWIKFFDYVLVKDTVIQFHLMSLSLFKFFEEDLMKFKSSDEVYLIMKNIDQNSLTKRNIKYSDIHGILRGFEKKFDAEELMRWRKEALEVGMSGI